MKINTDPDIADTDIAPAELFNYTEIMFDPTEDNQAENGAEWNSFILENGGSFLQSFEWGRIQKNAGRQYWRLRISGADSPAELRALAVRHDLPFGKNYLYIPFGPVIKIQDTKYKTQETRRKIQEFDEIFKRFLKEIRKIAEREKSIFLKIDVPFSGVSKIRLPNFENFRFIKSEKEIQPRNTIVLNPDESEETLLKNMKQKTRYNIRLAEKRGVTVREAGEEKDIENFWKLLNETAERGGFSTHKKEYYAGLPKERGGAFANKLFLAEHQGKILSGAIINFFGRADSANGRATYLHGASSGEYRDLMAPYLLQWKIIKEVKRIGFAKYDFWGVSEKYSGVTRFKEGFGGEKIKRAGAYDLVYGKIRYRIYNMARKIF